MPKKIPPLEIHTKPKPPIQVNRRLIITFAATITIVILMSVVWALNTTKYTQKTSAPKIAMDKEFVISPELKDLPENYSDVNSIKKYSATSQNSNEMNLIMQQLDDLKNSYDLLKMQLSTKNAPEKEASTPGSQAAKSSSVFFSGLGGNAEKNPTEEADKLKYKDKPENIYNPHKVITPMSKYQIMAGTIIPATLITGINSTVPGTVIAHISQNMYDTKTGKYLLIPKGSKAIGEYLSGSRIADGQERISLDFNRIIRPDNSSIELGRFSAADLGGQAGVEGNVDNHWGQVIGGAVLGALIGYGAGATADRIGNDKENVNKEYRSARQNSLLNASSNLANSAKSITDKALLMPPTITIPAGHLFNITIKKDIILTPYNPEF